MFLKYACDIFTSTQSHVTNKLKVEKLLHVLKKWLIFPSLSHVHCVYMPFMFREKTR